MSGVFEAMKTLDSAEAFLEFFDVPFEVSVLNVNRLHILQRFHQYLRQERDLTSMDEAVQRARCRDMLARAYGDFERSTAQKEKVFKVFRDAEGVKTVSVDSLRAALH